MGTKNLDPRLQEASRFVLGLELARGREAVGLWLSRRDLQETGSSKTRTAHPRAASARGFAAQPTPDGSPRPGENTPNDVTFLPLVAFILVNVSRSTLISAMKREVVIIISCSEILS